MPKGKFTRAQIMSRYGADRARTLEFVHKTEFPLNEHTAEHPFPIFNTLSAYQWLIYIPLHNLRHNQQIAEVKAAAGIRSDKRVELPSRLPCRCRAGMSSCPHKDTPARPSLQAESPLHAWLLFHTTANRDSLVVCPTF